MGEIVNLRRARKARARAADAQAATAARAIHGRTAAQKELEATAAERADRALDGCRITPSPDGKEG